MLLKCCSNNNYRVKCGNNSRGNAFWTFALLIIVLVSLSIAISSVFTYIKIHSMNKATCIPIDYSAKIQVCYKNNLLSNPYPVQSWVTFFVEPVEKYKHNTTITMEGKCGQSLEGAVNNSMKYYPKDMPIDCAIIDDNLDGEPPLWFYFNGYPWDQKTLMIVFIPLTFVTVIGFVLYMTIEVTREYTLL